MYIFCLDFFISSSLFDPTATKGFYYLYSRRATHHWLDVKDYAPKIQFLFSTLYNLKSVLFFFINVRDIYSTRSSYKHMVLHITVKRLNVYLNNQTKFVFCLKTKKIGKTAQNS